MDAPSDTATIVVLSDHIIFLLILNLLDHFLDGHKLLSYYMFVLGPEVAGVLSRI